MAASGFLLDTNVLSELMRATPAPEVMAWFRHHAQYAIYTSAVTQAEVLTGIALLPEGKRRDALADAAQRVFDIDMAGMCLPFDAFAAKHYAHVVAARQRCGHPISTEDAQIVAIALNADLIVATRNSKDFAHIKELTQINPFETVQS